MSLYVLQDIAQRTLLDCFKDLVPEEELTSEPHEDDTCDRMSELPANIETASNLSNWFDDLKEDDFIFIDQNTQ